MKPAFSLAELLPASGPGIISGLDGGGAVRASNARILPLVQGVVGHVVHPDIRPDVLCAPSRQWVDLHELKLRVPFHDPRVRARGRLIAANAGDPRGIVAENPVERLDLAQVTAAVRIPFPQRLSILGRLLL